MPNALECGRTQRRPHFLWVLPLAGTVALVAYEAGDAASLYAAQAEEITLFLPGVVHGVDMHGLPTRETTITRVPSATATPTLAIPSPTDTASPTTTALPTPATPLPTPSVTPTQVGPQGPPRPIYGMCVVTAETYEEDVLSSVLAEAYDAGGKVISSTLDIDANGMTDQRSVYSYNDGGQLVSVRQEDTATLRLMRSEDLRYNDDRRLAEWVVDADGNGRSDVITKYV